MKIFVKNNNGIFEKTEISSIANLLAGKIVYEKIQPIIVKEKSLMVSQDQINDFYKTYGFKDHDTVELKENKTEYSVEHNHSDKEARWTIKGKGVFFIPFEKFLIKFEVYPGDLIVIHEGVNHWYELPNDSKDHCLLRFFSTLEGRS